MNHLMQKPIMKCSLGTCYEINKDENDWVLVLLSLDKRGEWNRQKYLRGTYDECYAYLLEISPKGLRDATS